MPRMTQLGVVVTCLLAATTNAGAVTTFGLAAFVLPGVVIALIAGSVLAARRVPGAALIVGGLLVLGWSELVNVWSGTADGPVARATFVAAGCTVVAVVVARSSSPAVFLVAVAGSVCGALLLGAGGEVRLVAVLAAVSAALTLGSIERSRRKWTARPQRGPALVLLSLLVGAVAAGAVLLQAQRDSRQPEALTSGLAYPGIKPPWTDPLGSVAHPQSPPPTTSREATRQRRNARSQSQASRSSRVASHVPRPKQTSTSMVWLYVLAGILLLAFALAARLLAVRLTWRRLRRRLGTGEPAAQITGAWAWMRLRLEACRLPLAAAVSPDVVAAGRLLDHLPANAIAPLRTLATATTAAAFANEQSLGASDANAAWAAARQTETSLRACLTRRARVGLALRRPASRAI